MCVCFYVCVLACLLGCLLACLLVCLFVCWFVVVAVAVVQCSVARLWRVFPILTSKCASRHNGMHFFDISTSKTGPNVVCILTSKCASRHNGVHFLNISTSKSAPNPAVFDSFDFEMRFANTTTCTSSTAQLLQVLPS